MKFGFKIDETKLIYGLSAVVFLCALGLLGWFVVQYLSPISYLPSLIPTIEEENPVQPSKTCDFHRLFDGVCVDSQDKVNPNLVAVMIENHPASRPQSGLSRASIVYEASVEANYTRFMAIYPADEKIEKTGPVRSARPYYLDWLAEYGGAMYMHCGGSPDALQRIASENVFDVNEMHQGWYFWRDGEWLAPHNLFTSSELWWKVLTEQNKLQVTSYTLQEGWSFEDGSGKLIVDSEVTSTNNIVVSFLSPSYDVEWKYNSSTQKYERWQAGSEHRDADGTLLTADTVVVQHVKFKVLDSVGRISIDTVGSGSVEIYFDGQKISGTWKKVDRASRTRFSDEAGNEIKLKPGKIWVEIFNK